MQPLEDFKTVFRRDLWTRGTQKGEGGDKCWQNHGAGTAYHTACGGDPLWEKGPSSRNQCTLLRHVLQQNSDWVGIFLFSCLPAARFSEMQKYGATLTGGG